MKFRTLFSFLFLFSFLPISVHAQTQGCNCPQDFNRNVGANINSVTLLSDLIANQGWPQNSLSGCLRVNGTLVIDVDYNFAAIDARMAPGSEIQIIDDAILLINENSHLYACALEGQNRLWKGITLLFGGALDFWDSEINDAKYAVEAQHWSVLHIENVLFDRNYVGVHTIGHNWRIHNFPSNLVSNEFTCRGTIFPSWIHNENLGEISWCGVWADKSIFFNVGDPYTNDIVNKFNNMRNGIVTQGSINLSVGGAEFTDINFQIDGDDAAIYSSGSVNNVVNHNTFENVDIGIYNISNSDLIMTDNTIDANRYGVYLSVLNNNEVFISGQNTINSGHVGIQGLFINTTDPIFSIEDNSINAGSFGILLSRVNGSCYIHDNSVIRGNNSGVFVQLSTGPKLIKTNQVEYSSNSGFLLDQSSGLQIVDNTSIGSGQGGRSIWAKQASNVLYCCNTLDASYSGIQFSSGCNDTRLWNTVFNTHHTGLSMLESSNVGQQLNRGNTWASASTINDAIFWASSMNPVPALLANQIRVQSSFLPNAWDDIVVNATPNDPLYPMQWFSIGGGDATCAISGTGGSGTYCGESGNIESISNGGNPWSWASVISPFDIQATQNAIDASPEGQAHHWAQQMYVFRKIAENEWMRIESPELSAFYTNNQGSTIELLNDIRIFFEKIDVGSLLDEEQILKVELSDLETSILNLKDQLASASETERAEIQTQIEAKIQETVSILNALEAKRTEILNVRLEQADALYSTLSQIEETEIYQRNEKQLYEIMLRHFATNYENLSASERLAIRLISEQCPEIGGYGVGLARTLRRLFEELPEGLCELSIEERESESLSIKSQQGSTVFPNPANDQVTISLEEFPEKKDISFVIVDSNGKVHFEDVSNSNTEQTTIQTITFSNGIYFVKIYNGDRFLKAIKFVVNH